MILEPTLSKDYEVKSLLETAKLNGIEVDRELYLDIIAKVYSLDAAKDATKNLNCTITTISNVAEKLLPMVKDMLAELKPTSTLSESIDTAKLHTCICEIDKIPTAKDFEDMLKK